MPPRRAGAPRLIEWTGERLVPWAPDAQTVYEHLHRYLWAQPLMAGRRVLDLGSGEGFGAALLADRAASVSGVDIDERTVEHSRANYPGIDFAVASATDLSAFADSSFDAVVTFELIEHVADQEQVLAEIERVLAPGGLVVMSTPERQAYSDDRDFVNPYHERELTQDEFTILLRSSFANVSLFAQGAIAGSRIEALGEPADAGHQVLPVERVDEDWRLAGPPQPLYMVALASNAELPAVVGESTLFDRGLEVLAELAERQATIDSLVQEIDDRNQRYAAELNAKQQQLVAEMARAQHAEDEARRVRESVAWRALERARGLVYGVIGDDSALAQRLRSLMNRLFRALR